MPCEMWTEKLDAYLDGELPSSDAAALSDHLRTCAPCAAEALERVQLKRSVAAAGRRYEANPQLRTRILTTYGSRPRRQTAWWRTLVVPAALVAMLAVALGLYFNREDGRRQRLYSELADLHVSALASSTPVDVVSTDRHTVKPWFEGKIPFSFNLPELQGTEFTLLGGRVTYLGQTPGAHLIYQLRKHKISVFIFPDHGPETALPSAASHSLSFTEKCWSQNGLRYFVIGDVGSDDIEALSKLLKNAG